jgi:hypothetical protein
MTTMTPARTDRLAAVFPEMPVVLALAAVLTDRLRLRLAGTDPERGETIQWVIITAVGAAMAITVATIIYVKVRAKAASITTDTPGVGG